MEATPHATGHAPPRRPNSAVRAAIPATGDFADHAAARIDWAALRSASRSCCCLARPAVIALMPPALGRPHRTDLLLCMHHFRGARQALAAAGATVLDMQGKIIDPATPAYLGPE